MKKQAVLRIHECVTYLQIHNEAMSCFMLKRSQQLNLPYIELYILKCLKYC